MNQLTFRDHELVALGAAMGSNCVSCIEHHVPEATKAGLTSSEIAEAIRLADAVRQVPARKVLDPATKLLSEAPSASGATQRDCAGATSASQAGAPCCG